MRRTSIYLFFFNVYMQKDREEWGTTVLITLLKWQDLTLKHLLWIRSGNWSPIDMIGKFDKISLKRSYFHTHQNLFFFPMILLSCRYYLKNNMETETLCSDEDAQDLLRESQISLLQLSTMEVAAQLSMRDFELFRNIESTEYGAFSFSDLFSWPLWPFLTFLL